MIKYKLYLICFIIMFSCARKHGKVKGRKENKTVVSHYSNRDREYRSKTVVKMQQHGGVYKVPITVNSVSLNFIFDTGASDISISSAEAYVLYKNGDLLKEDILGDIQFVDATGKISTGTQINLRRVKIGNKVLNNVSASVVDNLNAPLLLGQSALSQFGKVTIDYKNNQLIFE